MGMPYCGHLVMGAQGSKVCPVCKYSSVSLKYVLRTTNSALTQGFNTGVLTQGWVLLCFYKTHNNYRAGGGSSPYVACVCKKKPQKTIPLTYPWRFPVMNNTKQDLTQRLTQNINKVIVGKNETIQRLIIALICGGHVLLEDVPGTAKTLLAKP